MSDRIILVAETGSDVPAALAEKLGVRLVPMHVTFGSETKDDGAFPVEEVCAYYDRTGKAPTTSGCTPYDFEKVYEEIFTENPNAQVLHLAYSSVTTCSYHSSELALEGKPYAGQVKLLDTKHVAAGQHCVVENVSLWLDAHPDATLEEAYAAAEKISLSTQMCFIPRNLDYLRAGGRVSNATAMVGNLLHLHPCIELINGYLIAGKKYRGAMIKLVPTLIKEYVQKHDLDRDHIYFIHAPYLEEDVKAIAEKTVKELGFRKITWVATGCVITTHSGPGAFGVVGMTEKV